MKWVLPIFAVLAGCLAPPVETPPTTTVEDRRITISQTINQKIDLLFMIDNSGSMSPKQEQLKLRFPSFISRLREFAAQGLPASYHLGVVTSDLGAGKASCGGASDGGRLNTLDRSVKGHPVSCNLGGGLSFIDYNQIDGTANVVGNVEDAFRCISSVGIDGCGFEHQLESVHHALTASVPENQGFLRDDAVLAVVFLTDEDDCSAPPDTDLFVATLTGTDYSQPQNYGPHNSFRCTEFGVLNGGEPLPWPGVNTYSDPQPAPFVEAPGPGKLFAVDRYIQLFTQNRAGGGLKDHPDKDLIVMSIAASPAPFRTVWADPNEEPPRHPCTTYNGGTCTVTIAPACTAAANPGYTGDPAVRLHAAVSAAFNHDEGTSICDDSYDQALTKLSDFILNAFGKGCVGAAIDHPTKPDCVVKETVGDESQFLPWCGDPNAGKPCWEVVENPDCDPVIDERDGSEQRLALLVHRDIQPQGTIQDDASCAIVADSHK
jgi:hypothetical protein